MLIVTLDQQLIDRADRINVVGDASSQRPARLSIHICQALKQQKELSA